MGQRGEATKILEQLMAQRAKGFAVTFPIAEMYATWGDNDRALAWLEKTYAENDALILFLRTGPMFDGLRSDPRFRALLRKVYGDL